MEEFKAQESARYVAPTNSIPELDVILLGSSSCGKTSFIRRFHDTTRLAWYVRPTTGIEEYSMVLDREVWDARPSTARSEQRLQITAHATNGTIKDTLLLLPLLKKTSAVVCCIDAEDISGSLEYLHQVCKQLIVQEGLGNARSQTIELIVCRSDLHTSSIFSLQNFPQYHRLTHLLETHGYAMRPVMWTSAKTGDGIDAAWKQVVQSWYSQFNIRRLQRIANADCAPPARGADDDLHSTQMPPEWTWYAWPHCHVL